MTRSVHHFVLCVVLLLAGCDQQAWLDRFAPKEEVEFARQFLTHFASRDFTAIEQQLDPSILNRDTRLKLEQVADQFPAYKPTAMETVGAETHTNQKLVTYKLTFQYQYPAKWLLAHVVLERTDGKLWVAGVHVTPLPGPLQEINRFTFTGKGVLHYIVFALAVAIPLVVVTTLVVCTRTPIPRRKWLWYLFIALGVVQFSLNWTDGAWGVQPLSFMLLGAGFTKAGPVAPWIFTVAFPLGAVVFLFRRRAWAKNAG